MGYGHVVPDGSLPIFSVDTEEEARLLLTSTCPLNLNHQWIAPELAEEQTLENLYAFGDRLAEAYKRMKASKRRKRKSK